MGYMHIQNLYKDQTILLLRECYALEKIHGTSARVAWDGSTIHFSAGGEKHERFTALFDAEILRAAFIVLGHAPATVYGEAYGGKQQAQAWRYGSALRFVAFEVRIGATWLAVPDAADVAGKLGFEFVHWTRIPATIEAIDAERDAPSEQARRNGIEGDKPREGIVLRPLIELVRSNDERVLAKHKRADERETKTERVVGAEAEILSDAQAVATEWVTGTRLAHVLDKLPQPHGIEQTGLVITAMVEDVLREGAGEIVDSKPVRRAIGAAAATMFKAMVCKPAP